MDYNDLTNITAEDNLELLPNDSIKFSQLKALYFNKSRLKDFSYLELLKEGSKFFTYELPSNICELFVRKEDAPNLWLLEFPLLIKSKQLLGERLKSFRNQDENSVKKYFQRWIVAKEAYQKQIFTSLTAKQIVNPLVTNSFLDLIYYSLILIYDDNARNFKEAIKQLIKAKNLVSESPLDNSLREGFNYYIEIYKAFIHMELGDFEEASKCLTLALDHNSHGITAKFYLAYIAAITNQSDFGTMLMQEVFEYDIQRLSFAINHSNNSLFNYFLNNSVFINIFYYSEFAFYTNSIEQSLAGVTSQSYQMMEELRIKIETIRNQQLDFYYTAEIIDAFSFFNKLIEDHKANNAPIFLIITKTIAARFAATLDEIKRLVKQKNYEMLEIEMKKYEGYIEENKQLMNQLSKELADYKEELKKKLTQTIQQVEEYARETIQEVESSIQNLDYQNSFNPAVTFRNSMSYNLFVSIIVFIIGGLAGYFNNSGFFEGEFNMLLGKIIMTGVKWSALTFVIGFFVSIALSGYVVVEKSNKKQRLKRHVQIQKKEREIAIDALKKEAESKQQSITVNFNERIETHTRKIEHLKHEKEERKKFLEKEAEKICNPIFEKLAVMYPSK